MMIQLLGNAIGEACKLSAAEQDAIAVMILDQIVDDHTWDETFARSQDQLARLADKARADISAVWVRPLCPHAT